MKIKKNIVALLVLWSAGPAASAAAGGAQVTKAGQFPASYVGTWGTSRANCLGKDDYGPLLVKKTGFEHYEIASERIQVKQNGRNAISLSYSFIDGASRERETRTEQWQLSVDGKRLTVIEDGRPSTYARCAAAR